MISLQPVGGEWPTSCRGRSQVLATLPPRRLWQYECVPLPVLCSLQQYLLISVCAPKQLPRSQFIYFLSWTLNTFKLWWPIRNFNNWNLMCWEPRKIKGVFGKRECQPFLWFLDYVENKEWVVIYSKCMPLKKKIVYFSKYNSIIVCPTVF